MESLFYFYQMKKKYTRKKTSKNRNWMRTIVIMLLLLGLVYFAFTFYKKDIVTLQKNELNASIPEGFPSFGIDISHHQGKIDWENLFADESLDSLINFVYCKTTEGTDHIDTQWESNRKKLIQLNKAHGAYHFFSIESDPLKQASHFLSHWKKRETDLPPVLDVETEGLTDKALIKAMKIWLNEVEQKTGMRPIIYTSLHFYETKFQHAFSDYRFWIAAYSRKPTCLEDARILNWQYSETGKIPGIKENVDLNVSKIVLL